MNLPQEIVIHKMITCNCVERGGFHEEVDGVTKLYAHSDLLFIAITNLQSDYQLLIRKQYNCLHIEQVTSY